MDNRTFCSNCGAALAPGQVFCGMCGTPVQKQASFGYCNFCGARHEAGDAYCLNCGKKLGGGVSLGKEQGGVSLGKEQGGVNLGKEQGGVNLGKEQGGVNLGKEQGGVNLGKNQNTISFDPNDPRTFMYSEASKMLASKRYDDAFAMFISLGDFANSKERAKECVFEKENARREIVYLGAIAFLDNPMATDVELKESIENLKSISNYKDANDKIILLEKRLSQWYEAKAAAEEALKKQQYDNAVILFESGEYDAAIDIFAALGDYSDSLARIDECVIAKEEARIEKLYNKSVAVITASSVTEEELKAAIRNLEDLSDYRDSLEKIPEVEARLARWYEEKAEEEEAERRRIAKAKAKKRRKIIVSFIIIILIGLIAAAAVFATMSHDIDYNLGGGTINGYKDSSYTMLTDDITLPTPTKEGYEFVGWTGTDVSTPSTKVVIPKWSFGDRSYTATWEAKEYTVAFNADGGNIDVNAQTVTFGANTEFPVPTKMGYSFGGWYANSQKFTNGIWNVAGDLELTALWIPNEYSITFKDIVEKRVEIAVTFNYNYSGSTPTVVNLADGDVLDYPLNPTREGYVFTGWYPTSGSNSTKYTFSGTITSARTLYAGWKSVDIRNNSNYPWQVVSGVLTSTNKIANSSSEYRITAPHAMTVSFEYKTSSEQNYDKLDIRKNGSSVKNCSGNTGYASYYVSLSKGDTLSFVYSKDSSGYTGNDCAYIRNIVYMSNESQTSTAKADCSTESYYEYSNGGSLVKKVKFGEEFVLPSPIRTGATFVGWYVGNTKFEADVWNLSDDLTVEPKWEIGRNTIHLNADGGTLSSTTVPVTYGSTFALPIPTKTGYTFAGWYNGTTRFYAGTWTGNLDITLVAHWTPNTYNITFSDSGLKEIKVTFNYNYSGLVSYIETLSDGETLNFPEDPTRSGYVFTGWYLDSGCTTKCGNTGVIRENMTLYAGWKSVTFSGSYSTTEVDPTQYSSSYSAYSVSTYDTSSGSKKYIYLVANESGTHQIYYKNYYSSSSYRYYLRIYNLTSGETIKSESTVSSTSYSSVSFTCSAGDVIVISLYAYNTYYDSYAYFYFEGFSSATSSITAESVEYGYVAGSSYSEQVTFGTSVTLPTLTRDGYRFLGWKNGNETIESGVWNYSTDLVLTPVWEQIVYYNVTFGNSAENISSVTVTYNYNYSGSTPTTVTLTNGQTLEYPTNPTRSGYVFTGWYTNSSCTTKYTFSDALTADTTLYAGWSSINTSYSGYSWTYSGGVLTSTNKSNNSSSTYNITAGAPVTVTFGYKTSSESGWDYLYIRKNGLDLKSCSGISSSYTNYSVSLSAGDTLSFTYSKDSSSSSGNDCAYIANLTFTSPESYTSTATAQASTNSTELVYSSGSSVSRLAGLGEEFILPTIYREGYTFLGWYSGDTLVESGVWSIASNITLTPRWQ